MEYLLTIPGTLNNLNDYITAERANRHKGAKMKADNGNIVAVAIRQCMRGVRIKKPVVMPIHGMSRIKGVTLIIFQVSDER